MKLMIGFLLILLAKAEIRFSAKIVGGSFARKNQFPHQVALMYLSRLTCGGSIMSNTWVLTAAHCVVRRGVQGLQVCAGTNTFLDCEALRNVSGLISHKNYKKFENDIALLRLEEPLQLSKSIKPIEIGTKEVLVTSEVTICGWGRTSLSGKISEKLKFNTVQVVSKCAINSKGILCLGHRKNNGACKGDSGGSAIYQNKLVGVANFITGGCGTIYADGYAKVSYFAMWIKDNMKKELRLR